MSKLKPCSFCGNIPVESDIGYLVGCGNRECILGQPTRYVTIDIWNTRANDKLTNFLKQCASFADSQDAFDSCALNGIAINAKALLDELNA